MLFLGMVLGSQCVWVAILENKNVDNVVLEAKYQELKEENAGLRKEMLEDSMKVKKRADAAMLEEMRLRDWRDDLQKREAKLPR